jgi:hypothetical protein
MLPLFAYGPERIQCLFGIAGIGAYDEKGVVPDVGRGSEVRMNGDISRGKRGANEVSCEPRTSHAAYDEARRTHEMFLVFHLRFPCELVPEALQDLIHLSIIYGVDFARISWNQIVEELKEWQKLMALLTNADGVSIEDEEPLLKWGGEGCLKGKTSNLYYYLDFAVIYQDLIF